MNKKKGLRCIQSCVNSYNGRHGKVVDIDFTKLQLFNINHVEGFTGIMNNIFYIVFRGSDGNADWFDNFKFYKKTIPYEGTNKKIKVHTGFINQYKAVRKEIHKRVHDCGTNHVIVTGHSLGGALATLCALDLQYNNDCRDIICVPIASPKVGNRYFVKSYNKRIPKTYRFVYRNDSVCKVPFKLMGFKHISQKRYLGSKLKWYERFLIWGNPLDHYPKKYLKEITEYNRY